MVKKITYDKLVRQTQTQISNEVTECLNIGDLVYIPLSFLGPLWPESQGVGIIVQKEESEHDNCHPRDRVGANCHVLWSTGEISIVPMQRLAMVKK